MDSSLVDADDPVPVLVAGLQHVGGEADARDVGKHCRRADRQRDLPGHVAQRAGVPQIGAEDGGLGSGVGRPCGGVGQAGFVDVDEDQRPLLASAAPRCGRSGRDVARVQPVVAEFCQGRGPQTPTTRQAEDPLSMTRSAPTTAPATGEAR